MNSPYIIGCCNPLLVLNSHILSCDIMVSLLESYSRGIKKKSLCALGR